MVVKIHLTALLLLLVGCGQVSIVDEAGRMILWPTAAKLYAPDNSQGRCGIHVYRRAMLGCRWRF
jgi:hypothetical protein